MSLSQVIANVEIARKNVNAHHIVKIVAVSKYVDSHDIEDIYHQGQRAFGENKVQDLKNKSEILNNYPLEWHHIGRIQRNKINELIRLRPFLVHGLDSYDTAHEYHKRLEREGETQAVLLQINSANEETKAGIEIHNALNLYEKLLQECPRLKLQGIMTIGAHTNDEYLVKKSFEESAKIFSQLQPMGAKILSMGMSHDYELAISFGANLIRVGSAIFHSH